MLRLPPITVAFFLAALLAGSFAADKKKQTFYIKPDQTADLHSIELATAQQRCENWALAAGLETLLAQQKVALDQKFWIMRLYYGELCIEKIPSIERLAQVVNQYFVLDDGRRVRLELHFSPGAPKDVDSVLAGLKKGEPALLVWRGHPFYLMGATYDEHIRSDGMRFFEIKELRLAGTFAGESRITFQKGRDSADEIGGIVTVSVIGL
jgi:hypothetical protein